MQKENLYKLLYAILIFLTVLFIVFGFERWIMPNILDRASNNYYAEVLESDYKIIVNKKYIDKAHHNNVVIIGMDSLGKQKVIQGSLLYSELYEIVSIGDTILKRKNSNMFYVNNHYKKIYQFHFNDKNG